MVKKAKYLIVPLLLVFLLGKVNAQFSVSATSTKVGLKQQFQVTFTANGRANGFQPPSFDGFQVLAGPFQSSSRQVINGQFSSSISFTYVLSPIKTGTLTIDEASIKLNGKRVNTKPLKITVVQNKVQQGNSGQKGKRNNDAKNTVEDQINESVFIKASTSNRNLYKGQQVRVTYTLYTQVGIYQPQLTEPGFNGFWKEEIKVGNDQKIEIVNGKKYQTQTISSYVLMPQKSGTITIDPMVLECVIKVKSNKRSKSPFDDFFDDPFFSDPFGGYENYNASIKSDKITFHVKDLPSAPLDYSGLVGKFDMTVDCKKTEGVTNDPITLVIKVSGKGNIKLLEPFDLNLPSDVETYEPKVKENISTSASGISGYKTFEYLLIPRVPGEIEIPSVLLNYFNPQSGSYEAKKSEPITLKIAKGDGTDYTPVEGVSKQEIELRGKDIVYIKTQVPRFDKIGKRYFGSTLYFVFVFLPFLLLLAGIWVRKKIQAYQSDVVNVRKSRASKMARNRLKLASKEMKNNNKEAFYSSVLQAVNNYFADKVGLSASDISRNTIKENLSEKGVSNDLLTKFDHLMDNCEMAQYAPATIGASLEETFNEAVQLISEIEKVLK